MASDSPHDIEMPDEKLMLELALEAARRANWDALQGPEHLRTGRYIVLGEPVPAQPHGQRDSTGSGGHPTNI